MWVPSIHIVVCDGMSAASIKPVLSLIKALLSRDSQLSIRMLINKLFMGNFGYLSTIDKLALLSINVDKRLGLSIVDNK